MSYVELKKRFLSIIFHSFSIISDSNRINFKLKKTLKQNLI